MIGNKHGPRLEARSGDAEPSEAALSLLVAGMLTLLLLLLVAPSVVDVIICFCRLNVKENFRFTISLLLLFTIGQ
jgi:hypothetical protein